MSTSQNKRKASKASKAPVPPIVDDQSVPEAPIVNGTNGHHADPAERKAQTKRDLELQAATGNIRPAEIEKNLEAQDKADVAGDQEDARPMITSTLVESDTPLPVEWQLVARGDDGRPIKGASPEAYLRLPITGSADNLRAWAAYYAADFRTVIDVVLSEDGKLVERFDGRGANRKPPTEGKPKVTKASGIPKAKAARVIGPVARVQQLAVSNPEMSVAQVAEQLANEGMGSASASTISMTRAAALETIRLIEGKPDKDNKPLNATGTVRKYVVDHPESTAQEVTAAAMITHPTINPSTISVTRGATLMVIKLYYESKQKS